MGLFHSSRHFVAGALFAAVWAMAPGPALAQTSVKLTLDGKIEGPVAPFVVAVDKDSFKAQGVEVTIETALGTPEALGRVAAGTHDMGFAGVVALMKFRDQNPGAPIRAVFMVYNK